MHAVPDRETFRRLAREGNLVPVWTELLADQETPVSAYERIRRHVRGAPLGSYTYLLESVEGGEHIGRYSFIGGAPRMILRSRGRCTELQTPEGCEVMEDVDPLDALRSVMSRFHPVRDPALPRFCGGAVGFMAYDTVSLFDKTPRPETGRVACPDMEFLVTDVIVVFDRVRHTIKVVANAHVEGGVDEAYDRALEQIRDLRRALAAPLPTALVDVGEPLPETEPTSNMTRERYEQMVEQAKAYIQAGDVIQVVLSQRFETPCEADSLDVYRALRAINPSPYMFCLDLGGSALVGASPEIHVRCEDGHAEVRPIAGTRPRSPEEAEDQRLERELLADPKERAEHIMLVDLGRNDLGRVCRYGSVCVPEQMVVERYSHVMHLVSQVEGKLAPPHDAYDLLRATFPAGTLSGAPKVRAMQIIAELEGERRGPYGGIVGYVDFRGNLDTCITIRTAVLDQGRAFVQAGAGIVADSVAETEYWETRNKARGMLRAIELGEHIARRRREGEGA